MNTLVGDRDVTYTSVPTWLNCCFCRAYLADTKTVLVTIDFHPFTTRDMFGHVPFWLKTSPHMNVTLFFPPSSALTKL